MEDQRTKMNLLDLPDEIILMILSHLDFQTLYNLHNTCKRLTNLVCMKGISKECHMSLNAMATANTLKLNFFKKVAKHLQVLNMCAVQNLTKTQILPVLKKLKSLKCLDVSYTNIHIIDLITIPEICPTLRDLSVNFSFGKRGITKLSSKMLLQCQTLFQQFENIHFVGSKINLLESTLSFYLLKNAKLNGLRFSATERDFLYTTDIPPECEECPETSHFFIYLLNHRAQFHVSPSSIFPVVSRYGFEKYAYVAIFKPDLDIGLGKIYASRIFKDFISEQFQIDVQDRYPTGYTSSIIILLWNKETNDFNDNFFDKLKKHLEPYLPYNMDVPSESPLIKHYDWFSISLDTNYSQDDEKLDESHNKSSKRRRIAPRSHVLDYDALFKEKEMLKLSLVFSSHFDGPIAFVPTCDYLKKLTYVSFLGFGKLVISYNQDFFNVLLQCCVNLVTLSVQNSEFRNGCSLPLSRALPLSKSIKNIRIVDYKEINFEKLFSSFSRCKTLENINVCDVNTLKNKSLPNPCDLLNNCINLHSVYIENRMSESMRTKSLQLFDSCKKKYGNVHLTVVLESTINRQYRYNFDPFMNFYKAKVVTPPIFDYF